MLVLLEVTYVFLVVPFVLQPSQVKSSHIYLYSAFHNTDCIKAASQ